jgi:uncharacterized membrane protein YkvA (DUF1232 family)
MTTTARRPRTSDEPVADGQSSRNDRHPLARLAGTMGRLPRYLRLGRSLFGDPRLSKMRKAALAAGLAYVASPIDLIPGLIPVAGQLDDLFALLTAIGTALDGLPPAVAERHLIRAGLSRTAVDADLETIRVVSGWLARGAARVATRAVRVSASAAKVGIRAVRAAASMASVAARSAVKRRRGNPAL